MLFLRRPDYFDSGEPLSARMSTLKAGDKIDRFLIESLVARGGMASIFRAKDTATGSIVALKVPHPESEADVVCFDRFERERAICRDIDHPGVVRSIETEDPSCHYLAMEWAEGRSLRRILEETPQLDPRRAVRIAISVCNALEHIHARGIVHRDLKPENIILGANDEVKLIDFGIAAKAGARRLTFGKLSRIMGTPDYISPEQVKGKRGGPQSDIYALGVILYEMLAGRTPFEGENPFVVMNDRLRKSPPSFSDEAPGISPGVESVVTRALERDPMRRYASAAAFARDLLAPGAAARDAAESAPRRRGRAMPLLFAIPTAVVALLIYFAIYR